MGRPDRPSSALLGLLTSVFTVVAFTLMWIGSFRCNFLKFTDQSGGSNPITRQFGIFSYQRWQWVISSSGGSYIYQSCYTYPDALQQDSAWKAAASFVILTILFSIILLIVRCCVAVSSEELGSKVPGGRIAPVLYLLTGIFQGLTLLILNSKICTGNDLLDKWSMFYVEWPETCSISTGAKCIISATVFWLAAALTSFQERRALIAELNTMDPLVSMSDPPALSEPLVPSLRSLA